MFHLTDTRLHTPCEMPYPPEHLTVNQGVTGSSPVGGAKLKEPRLARGSFNLIPPSEPEPAILSRNSQQPVGRLTHTLAFPRSGMRSLRPQGKVIFRPFTGEMG